jgi:putative ABC transport system permease protein
LAAAIWVGLLALANVRERRTEIGLLRALGKGTLTIASLFLGKAFLVGLLGAAAGFALGTLLAGWLGSQALDVATTHFGVRYDILLFGLVGAPFLSVVASYLPTLIALTQDPAVVLRDV